jgi:hypothetical protein
LYKIALSSGECGLIKIKTGSIKTGLDACVPSDSPTGICHKWFGQCFTSQTGVPVYFHVFDDGYQNNGGMSDAVYIHQVPPLNDCIPTDPNVLPHGICRKWFGQGVTQDGRNITCNIFDDGYTNEVGPTDAIHSLGILDPDPNKSRLVACAPDGSDTGVCRKWFGKCAAFSVKVGP